jgi:hypothetical protein
MRYRRYYSQSNPDGSRTVVSVGPFVSCWAGFVKFLLVFAFWAWPLAVIIDNLHGALGWVLGIGAELAWLPLAGWLWTAIKAGNTGGHPR